MSMMESREQTVRLTPLHTPGHVVRLRLLRNILAQVSAAVLKKKKKKGSTPTVAVIERAFTGGKERVVVVQRRPGQKVKGQKDAAPPPPSREAERAQSERARLASSTSHTQTPRERSQRIVCVCTYLPLGKSWGAAGDRTLLSPAHIRTQCKNTT